MIITIRIDSDSGRCSFQVFKEVWSNHNSGSKIAPGNTIFVFIEMWRPLIWNAWPFLIFV